MSVAKFELFLWQYSIFVHQLKHVLEQIPQVVIKT